MATSRGGGESVTWAERFKTNIRTDQVLKRNVLEIQFEKSDPKDILNDENIHRLLTKLGINVQSQVEGFQVYFRQTIYYGGSFETRSKSGEIL